MSDKYARSRPRGCVTGRGEPKIRYASRASAEAGMARLNVLADADQLNVYECASCGAWHIGHEPRVVRSTS